MSEDARTPLVVTIWEEYGSGADEIGREVAAQLAMPYYAQAFSSEDIEAGAIPEEAVESEVQYVQSRIDLSRVLSAMSGASAAPTVRTSVPPPRDSGSSSPRTMRPSLASRRRAG